jgi:hypothetical protein
MSIFADFGRVDNALQRYGVLDCALEPVKQRSSVIRQGRRERLAAREIHLCLLNMARLGIPVTLGTCRGLVEIVLAATEEIQ